jgi:hypothetical protein
MARPEIYKDGTMVCVSTTGDSRLQKGSDRRAIVDAIIDHGGCMSMKAIDSHFGLNMRSKVIALRRAGWLSLVQGEKE